MRLAGPFVFHCNVNIHFSLSDSAAGAERRANATLFTVCASVFGTIQTLEHFTSPLHHRALNKKIIFVFSPACVSGFKCKQGEGEACNSRPDTTRLEESTSVWSGVKWSHWWRGNCYLIARLVWVRMTLAGCGVVVCVCVCLCVVDGGQNSRCLCLCKESVRCVAATASSALPRPGHLSLWLQKYRKTTAGITSPRCWIKSSLYPQKSRINMKNVNVCAERRGKKDVLKYTFIQSLCEIKQQNWSALASTLAPLPPLDSPTLQVSTFCTGHRHDDLGLACCHLSSGQNHDYYGLGFIWLPWAKKMCLEELHTTPFTHTHTQTHTHTHNHKLLHWALLSCHGSEPLFPRGPLRPQTTV